jgi:ribA/ribD-fused uncharacterized protein
MADDDVSRRHAYFYGRRQRIAFADPACVARRDLAWASNFFPAPFTLDGVRWPTSEHYYQAAKVAGSDATWGEAIRAAKTGSTAARMGRSRAHTVAGDWAARRDDAMMRALMAKFEQNPTLAAKLRATDNDVLHEDAGANDYYWGAGTPQRVGQDRLGAMLMLVRTAIGATNEQ